MKYLKEFARQSCFDVEIIRDQFRYLWTAYCLYHELDADTSGYDNDLTELWNTSLERQIGAILTVLTILCADILYEKF